MIPNGSIIGSETRSVLVSHSWYPRTASLSQFKSRQERWPSTDKSRPPQPPHFCRGLFMVTQNVPNFRYFPPDLKDRSNFLKSLCSPRCRTWCYNEKVDDSGNFSWTTVVLARAWHDQANDPPPHTAGPKRLCDAINVGSFHRPSVGSFT